MSQEQAPPFGSLLRQFRTAAGLTQEALAGRAQLSERGIQDLERGTSQAPRKTTLALLAQALGLTPQQRAALLAAARRAGSGPVEPARSPLSWPRASGVPSPLVGRGRELALLTRFLRGDGGAPGTSRVLLLCGEPGMGKTRLLQAAAQQALVQGWSVLVGGCRRHGGQEPYAPVLEALAAYLRQRTPNQLRVCTQGCAWLIRLLPELAGELEPLPGLALPPEQERRHIFAAVTRLLANVAGPSGALLVLDDLQWAGVDALALLDALAQTAGLPLRLVGAYRSTEVRLADPLDLLLSDLAQAGLVTHAALEPLGAGEAAALLDHLLVGAEAVGSSLKEHVVQRAGGLPFFLVSYAQALRAGAAEAVPWDLAQSVRQRVALLPEAAQALLGAAAAIGRQVARTMLLRVTGLAEQEVVAGLEAACRARLLLEEGDDAYAFAHDVVREVVEADLGAARRAVLHRKVAEALEGGPGGAPPELLAYHYARSGTQDKAALYLEQAGDHAWDQRAHGAAEGHYREALGRLEPLGRAHDALRVRKKLSEVLYQTGRYMAASQALEPAAEALRAAGDWEGLGAVTARIGWMHSLAGTPHDGLALIRPILQQLEQSGAIAPAAALYAALGQLAIAAGQYATSEPANQRAVELARACGDQRSRVQAEYNRLCICQVLGRLGAALALGQEVVPLAEAAGHLHPLCGVLRDLAHIQALRGAFGPSREYSERATAVAGRMQDPGPVAFTRAQHGWILSLCGERLDARAELDTAVALSRQAHRSWYSPYPPILQARLFLAEGERAGATALVQEALELAEWSGDPQALRWASGTMAELDILEGRAEAARARLLPLLDRPGLEECDVTVLLPVLAWGHLELGQLDEATGTVEQALRRARPEEMRLVLVEALRVQAMIALRRGQGDEAARSLEEGLALARGMPYPYAEARLLQVSGRLYAQNGRLEAAPANDARALDRLQRRSGSPLRSPPERRGAAAQGTGQARTAAAAVAGTGAAVVHSGTAGATGTDVLQAPSTPTAGGPAPRRMSREERTGWVLSHLRTAGPISPRVYATAIGVDRRTALRDLQALVERGLLVARGTTKDRRYALRRGPA